MDNFAITAADAVSRRYKSNDPEAIIAQRAIKIKDIRFCEELLGFYTVLLNSFRQYRYTVSINFLHMFCRVPDVSVPSPTRSANS